MVILEFNNGSPNESLDINDLAYYVTNVTSQWNNTMDTGDNLNTGISTYVFIGNVSSILTDVPNNPNGFIVTVEEPQATLITPPASGDFIFFAKNNMAEVSSLKGYYGELTIENNSRQKAELFSIAAEITESSK